MWSERKTTNIKEYHFFERYKITRESVWGIGESKREIEMFSTNMSMIFPLIDSRHSVPTIALHDVSTIGFEGQLPSSAPTGQGPTLFTIGRRGRRSRWALRRRMQMQVEEKPEDDQQGMLLGRLSACGRATSSAADVFPDAAPHWHVERR